jgi:hypothetical protein
MVQAFLGLFVIAGLVIGFQQFRIESKNRTIEKMVSESRERTLQMFRRQEAITLSADALQKKLIQANRDKQAALKLKQEAVTYEIKSTPVDPVCDTPERVRNAIDELRREAARELDRSP